MLNYPTTEAALCHLNQHTRQLVAYTENLEKVFALTFEFAGAEGVIARPEPYIRPMHSDLPWLARMVHETDVTKQQLTDVLRPMFDAMRRRNHVERAFFGRRYVDPAALAGLSLQARLDACEAANPTTSDIEGFINGILEEMIDPCGNGCECPCDAAICAGEKGVAHAPLPCRAPLPWSVHEFGGGRWDRDDLVPMLPQRLWAMPAVDGWPDEDLLAEKIERMKRENEELRAGIWPASFNDKEG